MINLVQFAISAAVAAATVVAPPPPPPPPPADPGPCGGDASATALTAAFADGVAGITGADYQRSIALADGRTLWVLQDAFVERPGRGDRLVHNVGLVQDGSCFTLLRGGTTDDPAAWIAPEHTDPFHRWFWPLGATVTADGTVALFVAELRERGTSYLANSEPVATWVALIDPVTLAPSALRPAPDPGPALYGWAVASDDAHTYLYGHCYRQFGYGMLGHDACTAAVTVARTRRDVLDEPLEYWDGTGWAHDAAAAVDIAPPAGPDGRRRVINPMQVGRVDGRWIAVTKEGDWWGDTVYLDRAPAPTGPWTTVATMRPEPLGPDHHTYFASLAAGQDGDVLVGLSNNVWGGGRSAAYRPTFVSVPVTCWDPHPGPDPLECTSGHR